MCSLSLENRYLGKLLSKQIKKVNKKEEDKNVCGIRFFIKGLYFPYTIKQSTGGSELGLDSNGSF